MVTPPAVDVVIVASTVADVAPDALAATIATLQAATVTPYERVVGAVVVAGAL
jgi:hypothetical protein